MERSSPRRRRIFPNLQFDRKAQEAEKDQDEDEANKHKVLPRVTSNKPVLLSTQIHKQSSQEDAEGQSAAEAKSAVDATTEVAAQKTTESRNEVQKVGRWQMTDALMNGEGDSCTEKVPSATHHDSQSLSRPAKTHTRE